MYVIQRPYGQYVSGELADLTGARNLALLISQRFVRVATAEEIASAVETEVPEVPVKAPVRSGRKPRS